MVRAKLRFPIAILMTVLAACAADPAEDSLDPNAQSGADRAQLDDREPTSGAATSEQALTTSADAAAAGCAVVTTCNAAGGDGTRCRQQAGCSLAEARLECALESVFVCGAATCPVILIKLDGTRENLCNGGRL
jgi:hypothetical protein